MTEHTVTDAQETPFSVVLTCACGHRSQHPNREGAEKRHAIHVHIEEARSKLPGEGSA